MYLHIFDSFILGAIQGITEFFPISSTAHVMMISKLFGLNIYDKTFDVILNLGTFFAIICYFYKEVWNLFLGGLDFIRFRKSANQSFFLTIALANIPTIIIFGTAELLHLDIESEWILAINLIVFGLLLYYCDTQPTNKKEISRKDAIWVGIAQLASWLPGVSRLGICLSMCRYKKYDRWQSFKFCMLFSLPPVIGACVVKILSVLKNGLYFDLGDIFVGIFSAFIFGMLTLRLVYRFLKKYTFFPIIVYRIILGFGVIYYLS